MVASLFFLNKQFRLKGAVSGIVILLAGDDLNASCVKRDVISNR